MEAKLYIVACSINTYICHADKGTMMIIDEKEILPEYITISHIVYLFSNNNNFIILIFTSIYHKSLLNILVYSFLIQKLGIRRIS